MVEVHAHLAQPQGRHLHLAYVGQRCPEPQDGLLGCPVELHRVGQPVQGRHCVLPTHRQATEQALGHLQSGGRNRVCDVGTQEQGIEMGAAPTTGRERRRGAGL